MTTLDRLARDVGASGRTLRRAAARGLVKSTRPTPKRIEVTPGELRYVRRHWPLLEELVAALRTEPSVRLAVLFGSFARGESHAGSDLDLLVRIERKHDLALARLALRLSDRIGRRVQLVSLEDGQKSSLLLADVLRDGRVVIDRDGDWSRLRRRESAITRDARRRSDELEHAAWATLESLP
jgi:predicted nucleotidyltransferase